MKTLSISKFKWLFALCMGCAITAFGQKQTKSYSETFSVNEDVTIDVNTSYTDVEFETWDRDKVEIEAVIEIEGVSEEEAREYFKDWDFEALGNSGKVSITAKSGPGLFSVRKENTRFSSGEMDFDFKFEMPEMEEIEAIEPIIMNMELKELEKLPPMPPITFNSFDKFSFDYEAYKEYGEEYLEKWKKEFTESFDKNFKANLEAWKKQVEEYRKNAEKYQAKIKIDKEKLQRIKEAQKEKMLVLRAKAKKARETAREARMVAKKNRKANTFYFKRGSGDKNIKVKKTIKIKMPEGAKLKMNVRHGEVKLAENFKNIKATLSHTRLLATRVDGAHTNIEASFSPVLVEYWNQGKLKVNYVKNVALKHVKSVDLASTSSNVTIGNISKDAFIKGSFGKLEVKKVAGNFNTLEFILDNTDAVIALPESAFDFYCNTSNSKINFPKQLQLNIAKKYPGQLAKGYHKQKNSNKNINFTVTYSDIVIR